MNTEEQLLIIGQVTSNINQYVIKIVLDPLLDKKKHHIQTIRNMQLAIKGNENYINIFTMEIREKAETNSKGLQNKLKCNPPLYWYMGSLKHDRNSLVHPEVDKEKE